jgi:hypothetical protein
MDGYVSYHELERIRSIGFTRMESYRKGCHYDSPRKITTRKCYVSLQEMDKDV